MGSEELILKRQKDYNIFTEDERKEISAYMLTKISWLLNSNNTDMSSKELCEMFVTDGVLNYTLKHSVKDVKARILCFEPEDPEGYISLSRFPCRGVKELYVIEVGHYIYDLYNLIFGIGVEAWVYSIPQVVILNKGDKIDESLAILLLKRYVLVTSAIMESVEFDKSSELLLVPFYELSEEAGHRFTTLGINRVILKKDESRYSIVGEALKYSRGKVNDKG